MRKAVVVGLLLTVGYLFSQLTPGSHMGEGAGMPTSGSMFSSALLNLGPQDPALNASYWYTPPRNMMTSSADMTGAGWSATTTTVNDATHATFTAQNGSIAESVSTDNGRLYTIYAKVRAVTGNTSLYWYHSGLTPASTALTVTGTLTDYATTVTGDGGSVSFGLQDQNAFGWGQIEVTRWMVWPGIHTAAEAAALYQATGPKPNWWDYASGGNNGCFGGNCLVATTNDPANVPYDNNGWGAASREDLTHADWTATTATVTATTFTPTAQNGGVTISYTGTSNKSYIISAELSSAGNTSLQWTTGATNPAVTVTTTPTRYSTAYTGTGAAENLGLRDGNAAGWGAVTATDWQVERVPSGTITPSIYSAEATTLLADFDGVDDYVDGGSLNTIGTSGLTVMVAVHVRSWGGWQWLVTKNKDSIASEGWWIGRDNVLGAAFCAGSVCAAKLLSPIGNGFYHILIGSWTPGVAIRLYTDGALFNENTTLIPASIVESAQKLGIGRTFYYGSPTINGNILPPKIWSRAFSTSEAKSATCELAQKMWNYDHTPVYGAKAQCPNLDFTVAPTN